jgi:hypothetical protein
MVMWSQLNVELQGQVQHIFSACMRGTTAQNLTVHFRGKIYESGTELIASLMPFASYCHPYDFSPIKSMTH